MKTLSDVIRATEARGANAVIATMRGSPKLKDCFLIRAVLSSDMGSGAAVVMMGPDHTIDDASFDYYLADLDDPKTWLSAGVEPPSLPSPEGGLTSMTTPNNEKVVTSIEFSRILDERADGNEILAALNRSAAQMIRFEVRGRATVGGIEYLREGGPSDSFNRYAFEIIEIGKMAAETAEREPEGWVVVDAVGRPWCRVRKGLSEYKRGEVPFVFKDEDDGAKFAERINARAKGDSDNLVKSMSVREFAREAHARAQVWR